MKKVIVVAAVLFISIGSYAQHISINAFGGYTFRDHLDFGNYYAYINGGGMFGASIEAVNPYGAGIELLYQYQSTALPVYRTIGNVKVNDNDNSVISYLLLNFERYLDHNPKIQPYGGIGFGASFYKGNDAGNSSATKFAWDLKAGIKFKFSDVVGLKIGTQLLGSAQANGTYFYYGYAYTSYTTILQFGFTGGLVFDINKHK